MSQTTDPMASKSAFTAMVRDRLTLAPATLVAVSENVMLLGPVGAVKLGVRVSAPVSVTSGPVVCVHLNVAPSETVPIMFTTLPAKALVGAKNVRLGGAAGGLTLSDTVAMLVKESVFVTATLKLRVVATVTFGALKLADAVFAPESVTAGPPVCVQRKVKGCAGVFVSLLPCALRLTD